MDREKKGVKAKGFPHEYICIDVETTGVNPQFDRIIEVSAIHVKYGHIRSKFSSLIQLSENRSISKRIEDLTGITNEMMRSAPQAKDVILQFHQFAENYVFVGHNVNFDINFLYDACERCGILLQNDYIDTLEIARKYLPQLKHHRLSDLAEYFKFDQICEHRAEADAITTAKCFERFRSMQFHVANPDEYWRERMMEAVKEAKFAGKHTWEV